MNAVKKLYEYQIYIKRENPVFERSYVWHLGRTLNLEEMRKAASYLIGEHDFKSFCGNKKMKKSTIRRIDQITIEVENGIVKIQYIGNGFLMKVWY